MFLERIDWKNPRFAKWNLSQLGQLNNAQLEAFFEGDDIDFPDFNESELKELSLKVPCRVELFHSNVCHGVEKSWPKRIFRQNKLEDLLPHQKRILIRTMARDGVKLYKTYVNESKLKRRIQKQTNQALPEYYEERFLKNGLHRIRRLGDNEHDTSDSECSVSTVINTQSIETASISCVSSAFVQSGSEIDTDEIRFVHVCSSSFDDDYDTCLSKLNDSNQISSSYLNELQQSTALVQSTPLSVSNQMQYLRTNYDGDLFFIKHDDFPTGDNGIAMLVEVSNNNQNNIDFVSMNANDHIDITDDSLSDSESSRLTIDERFNDLVSECLGNVSDGQDSSDSTQRISCSTPHINSSEFIQISSIDIRRLQASLEDNLELFFSPLNQIPTSIQKQAVNQQ